MTKQAWDGHELLEAMRHAAGVLHAKVDEVNALNVFPVPDGDTGTNMLATVNAAIEEAEELPTAERSVPAVGAALRLGALMGARGNSGVILSQLFRGLGESVKSVDRIGGRELADALTNGCTAAVAAVAQPVEGTILTVLRDASRAASKAAQNSAELESVLGAAAVEAAASVGRTPSLLPILRKAGVVDAGGRGLELLLHGALASVRGDRAPLVSRAPTDIVLPLLDDLEAEGFGYETVFFVTPAEGEKLDVPFIRSRLDEMGESVLVAGDERAAKIHIHNERPDEVITFGLTLGALSRIGIENLDRQATAVREHVQSDENQRASDSGAEAERFGPTVVAVAAGDGLVRVFETLGAVVVRGGQGANPSTGELSEAITSAGNNQVIMLPNNPNVRMACKQAGELCGNVSVEVVPTRNAAEGVAALLAFDPDSPLKQSARAMASAARRVQTLQATVAVRDARIGRHRVHHGDYIVLSASDGLVASGGDRTATVLAATSRLKPGFELITVYRGHGVAEQESEDLRVALKAELNGVEIELVDGGQPHYDFLISAE